VILGTGVDLAEVARIRASIERYGERFIRRVFTEREAAYAERKANKYERYAARFAAKEAGMKAIGTGWSGGIAWRDLEITNLPSGRPTLALHGVAREVADRLGVQAIHLSLTHTSEQAIAWVLLEG
jgi:holo-[acyl-carrier protein] synthase